MAEPLLVETTLTSEQRTDRLAEAVRAGLGRVLVQRPRLIVLDEPLAGIPPERRGQTTVLLNRLRWDYGLTLLTLGGHIETVAAVSDRLLVLANDRLVEEGLAAVLLQRPQHRVTRALVGARLAELPGPRGSAGSHEVPRVSRSAYGESRSAGGASAE